MLEVMLGASIFACLVQMTFIFCMSTYLQCLVVFHDISISLVMAALRLPHRLVSLTAQVYNESIKDLFVEPGRPAAAANKHDIRLDKKGRVYVEGLVECEVCTC